MSKLNLESPYFNLDLVEKYNSLNTLQLQKDRAFQKKLFSTKGRVCRALDDYL